MVRFAIKKWGAVREGSLIVFVFEPKRGYIDARQLFHSIVYDDCLFWKLLVKKFYMI